MCFCGWLILLYFWIPWTTRFSIQYCPTLWKNSMPLPFKRECFSLYTLRYNWLAFWLWVRWVIDLEENYSSSSPYVDRVLVCHLLHFFILRLSYPGFIEEYVGIDYLERHYRFICGIHYSCSSVQVTYVWSNLIEWLLISCQWKIVVNILLVSTPSFLLRISLAKVLEVWSEKKTLVCLCM